MMAEPEVVASPAFLQQRFGGTTDAVRLHLETLEAAARADGLNEDQYSDLLIVLGEVLNNIVEHAFGDRVDGWIACSVMRDCDRFSIETCDNGTPLPPALLQGGSLPDLDVPDEDVPEGGFGWFIVHSLTDDMTYERAEGLNRLSFSL